VIIERTTIEPCRGNRTTIEHVVRCDGCDVDGPSSPSRQRARTDALCAGWVERAEVTGKVEHRCPKCDPWNSLRGAA